MVEEAVEEVLELVKKAATAFKEAHSTNTEFDLMLEGKQREIASN